MSYYLYSSLYGADIHIQQIFTECFLWTREDTGLEALDDKQRAVGETLPGPEKPLHLFGLLGHHTCSISCKPAPICAGPAWLVELILPVGTDSVG